jgi:hypothetical protein
MSFFDTFSESLPRPQKAQKGAFGPPLGGPPRGPPPGPPRPTKRQKRAFLAKQAHLTRLGITKLAKRAFLDPLPYKRALLGPFGAPKGPFCTQIWPPGPQKGPFGAPPPWTPSDSHIIYIAMGVVFVLKKGTFFGTS